ncbi:MAG: hypothetical protein IT494_02595 [Gammaproteobacteria bacterium]|nr:hypothetical protein [Gammaproteobacteria bacterium]
MLDRLNPWQRFWGIFALVMLASTLVLAIAVWPRRDAGLRADLTAPACAEWREPRDGLFPAAAPAPTEPCHALRAFLAQHRQPLRSEAEYDAYRWRTGMRYTMAVLLSWAAFVGALYLFGWAGASISGRFLNRQRAVPETDAASGSIAPRDSSH